MRLNQLNIKVLIRKRLLKLHRIERHRTNKISSKKNIMRHGELFDPNNTMISSLECGFNLNLGNHSGVNSIDSFLTIQIDTFKIID